MEEYLGTTKKIVSPARTERGMRRRSLKLIESLHSVIEAAQPITGRGVGYKVSVFPYIVRST